MRRASEGFPFSHQVFLAFLIPVMIWLLVSVAGVVALDRAIDSYNGATHVQHTIMVAKDYKNMITEIRDEERAYILTSSSDALARHREAIQRANRLYDELRWLSRAQPAQLERLERAGNSLQEWFYDVSKRRVDARDRLPYARVRDMQLLENRILAMLATPATKPTEQELERLRESLKSLQSLPTNTGGNLSRIALEQLDLYQDAVNNGEPRAATYLVEMAGLLVPVIRDVIDDNDRIGTNLAEGNGPALAREFQETMTNFIDAERDVLERYRQEAATAAWITHSIIWAGIFIGIIAMAVIVLRLARRFRRSVRSIDEVTRELARGNWSARAESEGGDDPLAERFNAMAELIERRHRETELLAELGETLHNCKDIAEALKVFGQFTEKLFPEQAGVLYLIEPNGTDVTAVTSWHGGDAHSESQMTTEDCWGLRLGHVQENRKRGTVRCNHIPPSDKDSLCVPLPAFGEIIGMLFVMLKTGSSDLEKSERDQQRQFVDTVAEQVALALANVKLRESLKSQSIRDPLTQLYNRRHLDDVLRRELYRAERHETSLSILAFDIDHFKQFNDEHGHDGGDAVLRCIGDTLRKLFRPEDGVFRAGGEEFVTLLPGSTPQDALVRAEQLRQKVADAKVMLGNVELPSVTISVGVASYPDNGTTREQLLKAADTALYEAKEQGRNRVVTAVNRRNGE